MSPPAALGGAFDEMLGPVPIEELDDPLVPTDELPAGPDPDEEDWPR